MKPDLSEFRDAFETMAEAALVERGPAPIRAKRSGGAPRLIHKVNAAGEVTGVTNAEKVFLAAAHKANIQAKIDGKRAPWGFCEALDCGKPFAMRRTGSLSTRCKRCLRQQQLGRQRKWREANAEKNREHDRNRYAACREKKLKRDRERYAKNIEQERERDRERYAKNIEQERERDRKRRAENRDKIREFSRLRYAENREKEQARDRKRHEANRDAINARKREARARKKAEGQAK